MSADYRRVASRVGARAFAGDFVLLGAGDAERENTHRECPRVGLGATWWLFAVSGSGDGWLVRLDPDADTIAFLDHDDESRATPKPLGIDFRQWVQLADLMGQVERATARDPGLLDDELELAPAIKRQVRAAMTKIARRLPRTFPYRL